MSKAPVYTLQFFLLCLSSFLFFTSFSMLLPELPDFLRDLGGGQYLGLIISLFTLTAGISRPFSGKLTDTIGRIPVMIIGTLVSAFAGVLYPFVFSVTAFMLLRAFHGFSTGFKPTATTAYVADIVPKARRGEALGYAGFSGQMGIALGPYLGSTLANAVGLNPMFYFSSGFAVLSVLILFGMKETLQNREPFRWHLLAVPRRDWVEPRVWLPSVIMVLYIYSAGVVLTLIPDLTVSLGGENKGAFFLYYTSASMLVRLTLGTLSDRHGRALVVSIGLVVLVVGMAVLAFADSLFMLFAGGVVAGLAAGLLAPALFAWTIDLGLDEKRGRAVGTLLIAIEVGIGTGALLGFFFYQQGGGGFRTAFLSASSTGLVALVLMRLARHRRWM